MICNGCGGVLGRDCYNQQECEAISHDMASREYAAQAFGVEFHPEFVDWILANRERLEMQFIKEKAT
jgi:hypothetical protein